MFAHDDGTEGATDDAESTTISFVHGYGQVLPAVERGVDGAKQGAHVSVVAEPEEAFGIHESEGVFEIEKAGLEGADELEVGEDVMASGPEGDLLMRVLEVRSASIVVDSNHPMAGKRVRFEIDVIDVRAATEAEIAEAQAEIDDEGACGCGHEHGTEDHGHGEPALIKLSVRKDP